MGGDGKSYGLLGDLASGVPDELTVHPCIWFLWSVKGGGGYTLTEDANIHLFLIRLSPWFYPKEPNKAAAQATTPSQSDDS